MASWLKAAEDLLEVVDRRAKLVVGERPDEQSDSQPPASNAQDSQAKRKKPRPRITAQKQLSSNESQKTIDATSEQTSSGVSSSDLRPDRERATLSSEHEGTPTAKSSVQTSSEQYGDNEKDVTRVPSSDPLQKDTIKHDDNRLEVTASVSSVEAIVSASNGKLLDENASDVHEDHLASLLPTEEIEVISEDHPNDSGQNIKLDNADVPSKSVQERSQSVISDSPVKSEDQIKDADIKIESPVNQKKTQEDKLDTQSVRVQDQLDEAQGLLKTTNSTGRSKEARLARVCAGLSSRLQEYKSENAQLEELLVAERELTKSYEARIKQVQQDLFTSKSEVTKVELNMAEALAAKNSEIEALISSMDALKKQAASSEGNLASLQVSKVFAVDTVDENGMPLFEQVAYGHPGGTSSEVLSHLGNTNSPRGSDLTQNNLPRTGTGNPRMTTERAARERLIDKAYRERLKQGKIQMESTLRQLSGENETLKKENERLQYENDSLNKTLQTERILVNQLKNDYDKQYVLAQILSERMACPDLQLENEKLKLENDQLRSAANLDYYILLAKENGELKLENKVLRVQNDALCGKLINDSNKKPA